MILICLYCSVSFKDNCSALDKLNTKIGLHTTHQPTTTHHKLFDQFQVWENIETRYAALA